MMATAMALVVSWCVGLPALPAPTSMPPESQDQVGRTDRAGLADAVALGMSKDEARRAAFHERYVTQVGGPVIRSLEVVTEFRRVVLLAEEQGRRGEAAWATSRAAAALAPYRGRLYVVLHLRFDPLNAYRSMPDASMVLYARDGESRPIEPVSVEATPENFAGPVPPGMPILAASVEAAFALSGLDLSSPVLVGVLLDGREIQRIPLDLAALR